MNLKQLAELTDLIEKKYGTTKVLMSQVVKEMNYDN